VGSSVVGSAGYNVKKSKSYGNFDGVNRDFSFQVRCHVAAGCAFFGIAVSYAWMC
jgi:hypothetical protein